MKILKTAQYEQNRKTYKADIDLTHYVTVPRNYSQDIPTKYITVYYYYEPAIQDAPVISNDITASLGTVIVSDMAFKALYKRPPVWIENEITSQAQMPGSALFRLLVDNAKSGRIKNAQAEQTESNIGSPNINIMPYEGVVKEAVDELQASSPSVLNNVTDIVVDTGGGEYGSVASTSPNTININLNKIKGEVSSKTQINPSDPEYMQILKDAIKEVLIHETAHVETYDPEKNEFVGGEAPAEQAQKEFVRSLGY